MADLLSFSSAQNVASERTLRLLIVEDSPDDAALLTRELANAGYRVSPLRVSNATAMQEALTNGNWDVIISDYGIPGFGAVPALELLKQSGRDIPFIILSGMISDEMAVAVMRAGAHDYIRKDNISRLVPAIERELQELARRQHTHQLESILRLQAAALSSAGNSIAITNREGIIEWVNAAFTKLTGYTPGDAIGQNPRLLKSGKHKDQFYKDMWNTILSGAEWRGEMINRRKDGSLYVEEMTITSVCSDDGEISHFVAVKEDISQRKQAEEAQSRLAAIVEFSEDAIISKDLNGIILSWNRSAERLFGYSAKEVIGRPINIIIPPDRINEEIGFLKLLQSGEHIEHFETVRMSKAGRKIDVALAISPIRDASGTVVAISKNARDIAERKQAEDALRKSEARYRSLFESIDEGFCVIEMLLDQKGKPNNWRFLEVNPAFERHNGLQQATGKTIRELVPDIETRWLDIYGAVAVTRKAIRFVQFSQALHRWFDLYAFPVGEPEQRRVAVIFTNITDRKDAEQARRESEERFRVQADKMTQLAAKFEAQKDRMDFALRAAEFGEWDLDLTTHKVVRSERHDQIFGYSSFLPEWTYESFLEHVLPEHRTEINKKFKQAIDRTGVWEFEAPIRWPNGTIHWIAAIGRVIYDKAGAPANILGLNMDITPRKQAELALQEREQQLQAILNVLPAGVFLSNANGKLIRANPAADAIWGTSVPLVSLDEYCKYKGRRAGAERDFDSHEWALARAVRNGEITVNEEVEIEAFDGTRKTILDSALPIRSPEGRIVGAVAINLDISDRKVAEQALLRSEKLASVGRMAATMSHEINNPLAAVTNALFLMRIDPALPESLKGNLNLAEQELARVSHMTKQTLGFYREIGSPTSADLPEALDSILNLYGPRLKNKNITVQRRYRSSAEARAVQGEVRQIASNLIANSIDALPQNGTLQVRLFGPQALRGPRRMLRITIADNGEGIARENLKRIFEPFFTTKQSIGTGLGLWVISELVRKHKGTVRVRSTLGIGTVVTVWLPLERRGQERRSA